MEFALLSVPLLVLVFGVLDFGLGIWAYNNLSQAVHQGAREAIVRGANGALGQPGDPGNTGANVPCDPAPPAGSIIAQVCTFAYPLNPSRITVTVQWGNFQTIQDDVLVSADYAFEPVLRDVFPFPAINLKAQAVMGIACCQQ